MKIRGWVYVLSNQAMPGLVKVGYSTKDPQLRIEELAATGLPHAFLLEYDALVVDPRDIEQSVHSRLNAVHEAKEFFRCSIAKAVTEIQEEVRRRRASIISEFRRNASDQAVAKPYMRATDASCRICGAIVPKSEYRCQQCSTLVW